MPGGVMAAVELAASYVTIIPSLKGAAAQIQTQLSGVGEGIGKKISTDINKGLDLKVIGSRFSEIGSNLSGVGDRLTKNITKPVTIAGGAVATLVSALGFKRLVGIDTARGQFQGLGHDADAVMAQVDKGVTNTALSMAEGASLAVGILATGNLPLEDLEGQLKRVANVSAAYGVDASQAGYLLNNVLTKNKVTYGDLSQMVQNQIPIISMLADHYGVTGDEIEKMAQNGEISIEDFNKVLDNNAGAAAEEYANTWKGVTSNIISNIGRLGADILDGVFPQMKTELQDFLALLKSDDAKAFAADVGAFLTDAFTKVIDFVKSAITWWNGLSPAMQKSIGVLAGIAVAAGPVLSIFGKITSGVGKLISGVGTAVSTVSKVAKGIKSGFETVQIASMYAVDGIKAFGSNVKITAMLAKDAALAFGAKTKALVLSSAAWVKNTAVMVAQRTALVASTVATKAAAVAQRAFNLVLSANPIGLIITAVAALVAGLIWFFTQTELGQQIWSNFTQFLSEAWANITAFLSEAWTNITTWFTEFGTNISNAWNALWTGVATFLSDTWANIKSFFADALQFIVDLFLNWTLLGLVIQYWDEIVAVFKVAWALIKSAVASAIDWVASKISAVVTGIQTVWNTVWAAVGTFFSNVWTAIVNAATGFTKSVKDKFNAVVDFVKGVPDKVLGFFAGIGTWLLDSGKSLIQGFLDGIMAGFNKAKDFVADGLGKIRDLFPFSPAKEGPFSGRGWVAYSGLSIGETFTSAAAAALHDGRSEIAGELDGIEDEFQRIEDFANGTEFTVRRATVDTSVASPFGDRVTLVDESGSILTHARVIAGDAVNAALAPMSPGSSMDQLGVHG